MSIALAAPERARQTARRRIAALAAGAAVLLCAAGAWALDTDNPHLSRGVGLIQRMEDTAGLKELMRALRWSGNTDRDRALIHLWRGIAYGGMLHEKGAARSFREALRYDPSVRVPSSVSPKIRKIFERIRRKVRKRRRRRPRDDRHDRDDRDRSNRDDRNDRRAAGSSRGDDSGSGRINWPAWIAAGSTAVALGIAIGLGVSSKASQDAGEDPALTYPAAQAHADAAKSKALGANVMFGVAAGCAVTSLVLFIINRGGRSERSSRRRRRDRSSAALVPVSGGLLATGSFAW